MLNKKILYGICIGLFGSKIYPKIKKNIKPITKKIIKGVIIASKNTKSFINEVLEEAEKENKLHHFESNKDNQYKLKALDEEQKYAFNKLTELKKQLEDVSKKVNNL